MCCFCVRCAAARLVVVCCGSWQGEHHCEGAVGPLYDTGLWLGYCMHAGHGQRNATAAAVTCCMDHAPHAHDRLSSHIFSSAYFPPCMHEPACSCSYAYDSHRIFSSTLARCSSPGLFWSPVSRMLLCRFQYRTHVALTFPLSLWAVSIISLVAFVFL